MKVYKDLNEAVKALKAATGSGRVVYFVKGKQVLHLSIDRPRANPSYIARDLKFTPAKINKQIL